MVELTPEQALQGERVELDLPDGSCVEVFTPALAGDGWRLRLAGVAPGGGDHFLQLRVRTPEGLRIDGLRVLYRLEIPPADGALGCMVVVPTLEEAGRWAALLELMGWGSAQLYPTSEGSPYEPFDPTSEITWGQLQVLSELLDGAGRTAIVATERALQPHLPPPAALREQCLSLRKGDTVDLEELATTLSRLGYERVTSIEQEGSWSRRGDIVDVFPVSAELPVRLEFFGEDLEKLREFDPASQRSLDGIDVVRLTPSGYGPLIAAALREAVDAATVQSRTGQASS